MKKIILCILIMLITTGCSIKKLAMDNLDTIVDTVLSKNVKLYNRISKGYKYYLPRGVKIHNYNEYNEELYSNGNKYYLYVDIVSYHYKIALENKKYNNSYYYKQLNCNNKKGYIDIVQSNDKYHITYEYNYAKIEAIVSYTDLNDTIKNMSYILTSLKYNDLIIDSFIGENVLDYKTQKYTIKKPKENDQTFLDYVNTYDTYKEEVTDDDIDNETIKNNTIDDNESTLK